MIDIADVSLPQADMTLEDAIRRWPQAIGPLASHFRKIGLQMSPLRSLRQVAADLGIKTEQLLMEMRTAIDRAKSDHCPWSNDCLCR